MEGKSCIHEHGDDPENESHGDHPENESHGNYPENESRGDYPENESNEVEHENDSHEDDPDNDVSSNVSLNESQYDEVDTRDKSYLVGTGELKRVKVEFIKDDKPSICSNNTHDLI